MRCGAGTAVNHDVIDGTRRVRSLIVAVAPEEVEPLVSRVRGIDRERMAGPCGIRVQPVAEFLQSGRDSDGIGGIGLHRDRRSEEDAGAVIAALPKPSEIEGNLVFRISWGEIDVTISPGIAHRAIDIIGVGCTVVVGDVEGVLACLLRGLPNIPAVVAHTQQTPVAVLVTLFKAAEIGQLRFGGFREEGACIAPLAGV